MDKLSKLTKKLTFSKEEVNFIKNSFGSQHTEDEVLNLNKNNIKSTKKHNRNERRDKFQTLTIKIPNKQTAENLIKNLKNTHMPNVNININIQTLESKETKIYIVDKHYENEPDNTTSLNSYLKYTHKNKNHLGSNINDHSSKLNVNKFQSKDGHDPYITPKIANSPGINENSIYGESPKSPSKWRKVTNLLKSVQGFHRYDTKNLGNESEIDQDLIDYKNRLHINTIRSKKSIHVEDGERTQLIKLFNMNQEERDDYKNNLKEDIYKEIIE